MGECKIMNKQNTKVCLCFNSMCDDERHILLLDYDVPKSKLKEIEDNLFFIQKKYDISTFYILDSNTGYNVISLSKLTKEHNFRVRSECKYTDALHNKIGYKRRGWVLRIGTDKKIISLLVNHASKFEKSNAHRILLNSYCDINIPKDNKFDNSKDVLFEKYVQKRTVEKCKKETVTIHDQNIS